MSTTYTEHYSFGKQENYADLFSMKVITDNWDSLDAILYDFSTGKQDKLSATNKLSVAFVDFTPAQIAVLGSGITDDDVEQIELNKNNISSIENSIIKMVAHTSANSSTSLSYETNINDFVISGGANSDKSSGVYLIICTNWSTTPAPYIGLLTFSGATTNNFVKTDVVTGFTPTITITQNVSNATIAISGAAKISIYATK